MNSAREIIANGALVFDESRIVAVGPSRELLDQYQGHEVVDCKGGILLPGLYDTHVHMAQCMLRGISEGKQPADFRDWLFGRIFPLQGSYTHDDAKASASLCMLEMLKSGTVGFVECLLAEQYGFNGIAEVAVEAGIRAALGKIAMAIPEAKRDELGWHPGMWQTRESSITNTIAAYDKWDGAGDGRIQVWFGCRSAEEASDPTLYDEVSQLASERDMGITIHLAEFASDTVYANAQGYRSHIEMAQGHGLLGPRTVLAHCTVSDDQDHIILAETGTNVSHNPGNNSAAAWDPAPVTDMLGAGVNVSLGCDGAPSNANMDILRDMRIACHVARMRGGSRRAISSETVLEMATINGAKALGLGDEAGSLEIGKKADFIVIDTDKPHLTPVWNPVATVVFAAQGSDVDTVVIDGKVIMAGREMKTMDEAAILDDVRIRFKEVAERAGVNGIGSTWPLVNSNG